MNNSVLGDLVMDLYVSQNHYPNGKRCADTDGWRGCVLMGKCTCLFESLLLSCISEGHFEI